MNKKKASYKDLLSHWEKKGRFIYEGITYQKGTNDNSAARLLMAIQAEESENIKLKEWLLEFSEISPKNLAKNAGIPYMTLYDLKRNKKSIPPRHWPKLLARLRKLGYK